MAKKTLQERFAEALAARGCIEQHTARTRKYRVFSRPAVLSSGKPTFYYLGTSGALRYGTSVSESVPASEMFKAKLLNGEA